MPQVDLSSVCGAHDRKVACETTTGDISDDDNPAPAEMDDPQTTVPDYAPESFWLSKDAEIDWLDQNAFIERKDSGKGSVISIPNSSNLHPNSTLGSQRYSVNLKSKASIIGLPKPQKPNYVDRRNCRPASIRLFPKKPGPVSGRPAAMSEPSSPKVSCMGRVRSRKERSRRGKNRKKQTEPVLLKSRSIKEKKPGFWNNFRLMFRSKGTKTGCKADGAEIEPVKKSSRSDKKRGFMADNANGGCSVQVGLVEPPGLGGVKRFASGRRSDAWAGDAEVDGAKTEPLDRGSIWRRRDRGPPEEEVALRVHHMGQVP
ncbi:hypothetical protein Cgig2_015519 [Carnegiea gigantea]|uniref:Calcium/calmodulin-dependent protein kinase n=1 Tax=Carnegiea gigantea TaxID=171969 RepID=A0A9Q1JHZ7_9CARY|nr:hypothetical protein Cgig2_015519 [Carnegiea gigantea]